MQANSVVVCIDAAGAPLLRRGGVYSVHAAYGPFLDVGVSPHRNPGFYRHRFKELAAPLSESSTPSRVLEDA